jgi:hypothetical protein
MLIDNDMVEEATAHANALLSYRDEDEAWTLLAEILTASAERQRASAIRCLVESFVRDALYPGLSREQWRALGWNDALGGRVTPAQFIHRLRVAKASGSTTGKL